MKEISENQIYKAFIKEKIKNNDSFCSFQYEKQMDFLLSSLGNDFQGKKLKILDACCGYGRLLHFLNELDSSQAYVGVDYVEELIEEANRQFTDRKNVEFILQNVMELSGTFDKEFDIAVNYKTLSWLPYYNTLIEELIKVTKQKIYITSLFYDGDIDFITKIYTDAKSGNRDNYRFLNTYSLPKFEQFCKSLGAKKVTSTDMRLDIDLPLPSDLDGLQTFTVRTAEEERIEITGTTVLNWKLIEIML